MKHHIREQEIDGLRFAVADLGLAEYGRRQIRPPVSHHRPLWSRFATLG